MERANGAVVPSGPSISGLPMSDQEVQEHIVQFSRNSGSLIFITDPRGRIRWANDAFVGFTGMPVTEYLGRNALKAFNTERISAQILRDLRLAAMAAESFNQELDLIDLNGAVHSMHMSVGVTFNDDASLSGFLVRLYPQYSVRKAHEQVAAANRRTQILLENLSDVVFELDSEGCFTFVNCAWSVLIGESPVAAVGSRLRDFIHSVDAGRWESARLEALDSISSSAPIKLTDRVRVTRVDRKVRWVDITLVYNQIGDSIHGAGSMRDVTESVQNIAEIRSARDFSDAVLEASGHLIVVVDPAGTIIRFNRACELVTGYRASEVIGKSFLFLIPDNELESVLTELNRLGSGRIPGTLENGWRHRDGSVRIIKWFNSTICDDSGVVVNIVSSGTDVTDLRATQAQAAELQTRYDLCVNGVNDGVWDIDPSLGTSFYSPRWYTMLGYEPYEMPPSLKLFWDLVHPDDARAVKEASDKYASREISEYSVECRMRQKDGSYRWIRTRGAGLFDSDGKLVRMAGSHTDIQARREAMSALLEKEAWNKEAHSLAKLGTWKVDFNTLKVQWSREMYAIYGIDHSLPPPTAHEVVAMVEPSEQHLVGQLTQEILEGKETSSTIRIRIHRPDGQVRHLQSVGRPMTDEDGNLIGIIGTSLDVTESVLAQQELERNQRLLLESQRIAKLGSWEVDVATEALTVSHQTYELFGRIPTEDVQSIADFSHAAMPFDGKRLLRYYRMAVADQAQVDFDFRVRLTNGHRRVMRVLAQPVMNEAGEVIRLVGSVQDVTDAREAEKILANQKLLLEKIIQTSPNIIFIKDSQSRFVVANKAIADVLGLTPSEMIGKSDHELMPKQADADWFESVDQEVMRTGNGRFNIEESFLNACGEEKFFLTSKVPIVSPETGEVQLLGVATEVTERVRTLRQLEAARHAALESSRMKSEFLANMSHEIRTPMNGILGMAELLMDTRLDAEQAELSRTIRECGESLLSILNDILDFSKVEAGKMAFALAPTDVAEIVEEVATTFAPKCEERGVRLELSINWADLCGLSLDSNRLRQILNNLVGNAVKFTDRGTIELGLSAGPEGSVLISVQDTGIGIAPEQLSAIFESFVQVDGSTTRKFGGTGLGLAIAKQLTELMGGTIRVTSKLDVGSRFILEFPSILRVEIPRQTLAEGCRLKLDSDLAEDPAITSVLTELGIYLDGDSPEVALVTQAEMGASIPQIALSARREERNEAATAVVFRPLTRRAMLDALRKVHAIEPQATVVEALKPSRIQAFHEVLLVEDNAVNRSVALRQLLGVGIHAQVAENGVEALAKVGSTDFDLVFMDVQMPEMDGLEATARIREFDRKNGRHTTIIAMTAHAMEGDRERCLAAGMDDYISKPFRKDELQQMISIWLPEDVVETSQIDLTYLSEIAGDDIEFQRDVLMAYAEALPPMLSELQAALDRGDAPLVYRVAHTLKGSSRSIGAEMFARACEVVETAARNGDLSSSMDLPRKAEALLAECNRLTTAV